SQTLFAAENGSGNHGCDPGVYISQNGGESWAITSLQVPDSTFQFESLYIDTVIVTSLFVSAGEGVYGSFDRGSTWDLILDTPCYAFSMDFSEETGYCGTGSNNLLKTTDGGITWSSLQEQDFIGYNNALLVLPGKPESLFIGGNDIYASTDGGESWAERSSGLGMIRIELFFNPSNSAVLYAEDQGSGRLYQSADNGSNWELFGQQGNGLAFDASGEIIYRNDTEQILRSRDMGQNWDGSALPVGGGQSQAVAAHPQQPEMVFSLYGRTTPPFIFYSTDGGRTWQASEGMSSIHDAMLFFDHDQGQVVYAIGDQNFFHSEDGGKTWGQCPYTEHYAAQSHSRMVIDPRDSNHLILATRGAGVQVSIDGCQSWKSSNDGLGNLFVNTLAVDLTNPDTLYAGTDSGAYVTYNSGKSWFTINDGLLGSLVIYLIVVDPQDSSNVYAATPLGIFNLESDQ
ncbi:MAG: hypothetical protein MUO76_17195, partial [Anaerolineaceae bacterium]|nr:hypothetical protein [Anaerolineaceae bacterium]